MSILKKLGSLFGEKQNTNDIVIDTVEKAEAPVQYRVLELLHGALNGAGFELIKKDKTLNLSSGIQLQVELLDMSERSNDHIRTSTRIFAQHKNYFPDGVFEYQHAIGGSAEESIASGFSSWIQMDLATLEDSIKEKPENSSFMEMQFPADHDQEAFSRRVVLGPVGRMVSNQSHEECEDEMHPFCPCCFTTNTMTAFTDLLKTDQFIGIRFFGSRDNEGNISADCRVNGEDYPEGVEPIISYVQSWPDRGFEFRKQYVVIRSSNA